MKFCTPIEQLLWICGNPLPYAFWITGMYNLRFVFSVYFGADKLSGIHCNYCVFELSGDFSDGRRTVISVWTSTLLTRPRNLYSATVRTNNLQLWMDDSVSYCYLEDLRNQKEWILFVVCAKKCREPNLATVRRVCAECSVIDELVQLWYVMKTPWNC